MSNVQHFSGVVTPIPTTATVCGLHISHGAAPSPTDPYGLWWDTTKNCIVVADDADTYDIPSKDDLAALTETWSSTGSHQTVAADLTLDAAAGKNAPDTAYLGPFMGNLWGADLTKTGNYLGGVIGAYSITGALASHYPSGAVLAQITDGVTAVKGAVVAYIDGDSSQTNAEAAFKVMNNNSTAASGFDYGLDLYDAGHDGFGAVSYKKAPIRISAKFCILANAGVPDATVGVGFADKGSLCSDTTNGNLYVNTGDATTPVWKAATLTP